MSQGSSHDLAASVLNATVAQHGRDFHADLYRCRSVLSSALTGHPKELSLLLLARDLGVPADAATGHVSEHDLVRRVVEKGGIAEGDAAWAVRAWSVALRPTPPGPNPPLYPWLTVCLKCGVQMAKGVDVCPTCQTPNPAAPRPFEWWTLFLMALVMMPFGAVLLMAIAVAVDGGMGHQPGRLINDDYVNRAYWLFVAVASVYCTYLDWCRF